MASAVNTMGGAMRAGINNENSLMQLEDEKGINSAYEYIAQKVGTGGDISTLETDPIMNTRHGVQAFGKFFKDRAASEGSRAQMLKNMVAGDDAYYQDFVRPEAYQAMEAYKSGDLQTFGKIAESLSDKVQMPYRYRVGPDGNLQQEFRSDAAGGFVSTGRSVSPQEALNEIQGLVADEHQVLSGVDMKTRYVSPRYNAAVGRFKMGTVQGNAENMANPAKWIPLTNSAGHTVYAIPQNRHDDYSAGPSFRILDEGKGSYMAGSMEDLLAKGYVPTATRKKAGQGQGQAGAGNAMRSAMHQKMLETGYIFDKDQGSYFKVKEDSNGKAIADYSQPASREFMERVYSDIGGAGGAVSVGPGAAGKNSKGVILSAQQNGNGKGQSKYHDALRNIQAEEANKNVVIPETANQPAGSTGLPRAQGGAIDYKKQGNNILKGITSLHENYKRNQTEDGVTPWNF